MYCQRLEELRKAKGMSHKQWSIESGVSIDTIQRITHPEHPDKDSTKINTLEELCKPLGVELWELFYNGDNNIVSLRAERDALADENEKLRADNEKLQVEKENSNIALCALRSENEILHIKLAHKDEIIAIHNYYNNHKANS